MLRNPKQQCGHHYSQLPTGYRIYWRNTLRPAIYNPMNHQILPDNFVQTILFKCSKSEREENKEQMKPIEHRWLNRTSNKNISNFVCLQNSYPIIPNSCRLFCVCWFCTMPIETNHTIPYKKVFESEFQLSNKCYSLYLPLSEKKTQMDFNSQRHLLQLKWTNPVRLNSVVNSNLYIVEECCRLPFCRFE